MDLAIVVVSLQDGKSLLKTLADNTDPLLVEGSMIVALILWAWKKSRTILKPLNKIKEWLATVATDQWKGDAALRSLEPNPKPVQWTYRADLADRPANVENDASVAGALHWSGSSANIAQLATRFRATRRRRLVILGEKGMGKTTLALQLMMHLLRTAPDDEPVPVLLPASGWDTTRFPRLHDWVADRLLQNYPALRSPELGGPVMVKALVHAGKVLPVLDGLDELPLERRPKMIATLNRSLTPDDWLIVTSRTAEYETSLGRLRLASAAVLQAEPLDAEAVADYLEERCLPTDPGHTWQRILNELRASRYQPIQTLPMVAELAQIASTPLGLWLLRTVYIDDDTADPGILFDSGSFIDTSALRDHLFDQLIPALIAINPASADPADPFQPRRLHDPHRVRQWLEFIAHHLTYPRVDDNPRTHNFAWWELARYTNVISTCVIRLTLTLASALALGATIALGRASPGWLMGGLNIVLESDRMFGLIGGFVVGIGGGTALWLSFSNSSARWQGEQHEDSLPHPERFIRNRLSQPFRGGVVVGLIFALVATIAVGLIRGLSAGVTFGIAAGLTFGLVAGATFGLVGGVVFNVTDWWNERNTWSTPNSTLRGDRGLTILSGSVVALTFALTFGIVVGVAFGLAQVLAGGLAGRESHAWIVFSMTKTRLAMKGRLPWRLGSSLDDLRRLGLLRSIGPLYQFRHAELQDHLATSYETCTFPFGRG
ncbi:NACHT domain-containing protein [Nonomuraea angiospora]|uniref:NACHT domain-containing protein n=1 Tax=Nonomuraea angiospora TaxID=46172 RepID=UPI0033D9B453